MKTLSIVIAMGISGFFGLKMLDSKAKALSIAGSRASSISAAIAVADFSRNVEYDFGKASIRENYYSNLNALAKYLIDNKKPIALRGYADSIGGFKANWVLSDKRATEVKKYLVKKGVPADKIVATPFGSTKPIASNKTSEGRQKNRRVELKVKS